MSTQEEREQFCIENPDHDRCGCQRIIEDYFDHYKEYENKKNLRDNWWEPELEKYNKAYKNIKDYIPIGKDIYDLHADRTSLINGGLNRNGVQIYVEMEDVHGLIGVVKTKLVVTVMDITTKNCMDVN